VLSDQADLEAGKIIFNTQCAVCHGTMGEGGIGPNMTDQYWIHGGSIKDIFKTVKYGVPEKGMISWKSQLSAGDMAKVSSYILTLVGTNPPNQKEPQGELYQEQVETEAQDTTGSQAIGMVVQ
jgi:cytochrome c oxidase cbb3-type subunit 3